MRLRKEVIRFPHFCLSILYFSLEKEVIQFRIELIPLSKSHNESEKVCNQEE